MSDLFTTGQIAEMLREPPTRVEYIIRRHRLKPVDRVGIIRLFNEVQVAAIKEKIFNMQIRVRG